MNHRNSTPSHPHAVLGSGDVVTHLQFDDEAANRPSYRFSLFRMPPGQPVTHDLRPSDLRSVVKLCQVLAFAIAEGGCVPDDVRNELFELADDLDYITHQWSNDGRGTQNTA